MVCTSCERHACVFVPVFIVLGVYLVSFWCDIPSGSLSGGRFVPGYSSQGSLSGISWGWGFAGHPLSDQDVDLGVLSKYVRCGADVLAHRYHYQPRPDEKLFTDDDWV